MQGVIYKILSLLLHLRSEIQGDSEIEYMIEAGFDIKKDLTQNFTVSVKLISNYLSQCGNI